MKRLFLYIIALLAVLLPASLSAETVSQKQASLIAARFFSHAKGSTIARTAPVYNGKRLTTDRLFTPFYVYNSPAGGFVVVSAEDKAFPILAWSPSGAFDPDKVPKEVMAMLRAYAYDIERIRYDASPVDGAVAAWRDIDGYIASVLSPTNPKIELPVNTYTTRDDIRNLLWNDELYTCSSDIYTPGQWQDMVTAHLKKGRALSLGIHSHASSDTSAVSVSRMNGDYFGIDLPADEDSSVSYPAWMRLHATEVLSDGLSAAFVPIPEAEVLPEPEEDPFAEQDMFLASVKAQSEETKIPPVAYPLVSAIGGGRYMVTLPQEARLAMVFNISGATVRRHTYSGQNTVLIDIAHEPAGFYLALIFDKSGRPYGFKLAR